MEPIMKPAAELRALEVFLGSWEIKGKNLEAAPVAPNTPITGNIFFQYMPGHFFVTSNWNRKYRFTSHIGMSIIGYDPNSKHYFMENFDNAGNRSAFSLTNNQGVWQVSGENERAEIRFNGPHAYSERWEILEHGKWKPVCEMEVIKI